ncbi:hypothetical protein POM88_033254 [Heracleum sosnowskyi]|uniref:Uncharacterized protein n=1 Tax=Heracleum sosnowskyi TaxID=360622 RepID=A0AAD8I172_9APIA|nr:hypothetical protein POM88_033254 [Heracleum sosnowskyi]
MNTSHYPRTHFTICPSRKQSIKNLNFRAHCIHRRKRTSKQAKEKARRLWILKRKMLLKNLKLYTENKSIIIENEKLRKKAAFLHIENMALHSLLQINSPTQLALLPNEVEQN